MPAPALAPLLIGVGGATCSGKTTLSKHLVHLLSSTPFAPLLLHQDDFAPSEAALPLHTPSGLIDWDDPPTAIDYARLATSLAHLHDTGTLPPTHLSHDHLNVQPECPVPPDQARRWIEAFRTAVEAGKAPVRPVVLVDGFLLYYSRSVWTWLDVRLFLRVGKPTLQRRREARGGYATAEGTTWQDPPGYFDTIVWPAYLKAHRRLFHHADVTAGRPVVPSTTATDTDTVNDGDEDGGPVPDLIVLEGDPSHSPPSSTEYPTLERELEAASKAGLVVSREMAVMLERACLAILDKLVAP